jgi:parvulin-like peptidyl-prolyl isomerase
MLSVAAAVAAASPSPTLAPDTAVISVGRHCVTAGQFERYLAAMKQKFKVVYHVDWDAPERQGEAADARRNLVNELIERLVLHNDADLAGITVSEAEVDAEVAKVKQMLGTEANFQKWLAKVEFMTLADLRERIRDERRWQALVKRFEARRQAPVTDAEVKAYYDDFPEARSEAEAEVRKRLTMARSGQTFGMWLRERRARAEVHVAPGFGLSAPSAKPSAEPAAQPSPKRD